MMRSEGVGKRNCPDEPSHVNDDDDDVHPQPLMNTLQSTEKKSAIEKKENFNSLPCTHIQAQKHELLMQFFFSSLIHCRRIFQFFHSFCRIFLQTHSCCCYLFINVQGAMSE